MSLLDDVSIVVTPNGYKAGELYAVIPVPTEGTEEVTNGDFATDSGWSKGGGATISGGQANIDGDGTSFASITQSNVFTEGKRYKVTADVIITSGLGLKFQDGANNENIGFATTTGSYEFYFIATSNTSFVIGRRTGGTAFDSSVDNVSVKEYTSADMDVTRATAATRVDEDGLVNYAEIIGSEDVTNGDFSNGTTDWTTGNSGVLSIVDGALVVTGDGGSFASAKQVITGVVGKTYKLTGKVAVVSGSYNVRVETDQPSWLNLFTTSSTDFVNFEAYFVCVNTSIDLRFTIYNATTTSSDKIKIDNISLKQADRDNVPRIDYTGGGCPHILSEPQRTNLIPYSEDLTDTYWNKLDGLTASSLAGGLSPDGLTNSDLITINNGRLNKDISVSNSTAYTLTAYFKGTVGETINMDLGTSTKLITLTGLWQRESINLTTTSTFTAVNLIDNRSSGTASTVEVWGAQLEEGSYATSYIPTSGSTVTRNQDIFTRDGIGSLINDSEGVLFAEWKPKISSDYSFFSINNGTSSETVTIGKSNNTTSMVVGVRHLGAYKILYVSSSHDLTIFNKVAVKWKAGDYAIWVNGVEVLTSTSATIPTAMNKLSFDFGDGGLDFYGEIKQLQVYKTALTDEQLTSLTT